MRVEGRGDEIEGSRLSDRACRGGEGVRDARQGKGQIKWKVVSLSQRSATRWLPLKSVLALHGIEELFAGVDAHLAINVVHVGFHRVA